MNRTIDYSALVDPVSKEQIRSFKAVAKQRGWGSLNVASTIIAVVVGTFVVSIFFSVFSGFVALGVRTMSESPNPVSIVSTVFPFVVLFLFLGVGIWMAVRAFGSHRWESWFRLDSFATANGFVFSPRDVAPSYPGAIFNQGHSREALNHIRSSDGRFIDIGNYKYVTGSGKNSTTHDWGFMAFRLDRSLPHIVLDARANNGLFGGTNLPAFFAKEQKLSLEGNFNEYFTLYCPSGYERDALYVFTPDLMALLIDEAAPFDVEIIDQWMFVYSATRFDTSSPATFQRLFRILDTVGAKTLDQTERYADDRVGNPALNLVAPQGKRLRKGIPVGAVIMTVAIVGFWLWGFVGDNFF